MGKILWENGFPRTLLLVADRNTLAASDGIIESLSEFLIEYHIYDEIRVARMEHVEAIERLIAGRDIGILSVGTGSVNDLCRLAAARQGKMLCIFATAGFRLLQLADREEWLQGELSAKSPEVIIGDTNILAAAPQCLKSAGFGDMVAKYIALADWKISSLLTDEVYCERVGKLTRDAVDKLLSMADRVTENDPETAGEIFRALLMTGIGMSFMHNSRPASGSEHIISHLIECVELRKGITPNYHGEDIGVCTLLMLKYYNELAERETITAGKEHLDWDDIYAFYGEMADDVRALNEPTTITDAVEPAVLQQRWPQIRQIIHELPDYDTVYSAMKRAGCKLTAADIGEAADAARRLYPLFALHAPPSDASASAGYDRVKKEKLQGEDKMDTRNIKLLAFDLDGTITQHKSPLSASNRELLDLLSKKYRLLIVGAGMCDRIFEQMRDYPIDIIGNYGMQYAKCTPDGSLHIIENIQVPCDRASVEHRVTALRKKIWVRELFWRERGISHLWVRYISDSWDESKTGGQTGL